MAFLPSLMHLLPPQVLLLGIVSKIHHLQALLSGNPGRQAAETDALGSVSEEMGHSPGFGWGLGRGMKAVRACTRASALGNRPHAAGETVKIKGYMGKGREWGWAQENEKGHKDRPGVLSSCQIWFPWGPGLCRNSHPLSFWLTPPHITAKAQVWCENAALPPFWAQVLQNQRPSLKTSSCVLTTRVPLQSTKTSSKLSWVENSAPTPPPHQPSLSLQFSSSLQETGLTSSPSWEASRLGDLGIVTDPSATVPQLCSGNKTTQAPPYTTWSRSLKAKCSVGDLSV